MSRSVHIRTHDRLETAMNTQPATPDDRFAAILSFITLTLLLLLGTLLLAGNANAATAGSAGAHGASATLGLVPIAGAPTIADTGRMPSSVDIAAPPNGSADDQLAGTVVPLGPLGNVLQTGLLTAGGAATLQ